MAMDQGGVLPPLKEQLLGSGLSLPLASSGSTAFTLSSPRVPSPPPGNLLISPRRTSAFESISSAKSKGDEMNMSVGSVLDNARTPSPPPAGLGTSLDSARMSSSGTGLVPAQLSAFPLFGGSGLPQAQSKAQEATEEDLAAWQPFFAPAPQVLPAGVALGMPSVGASAVGSHLMAGTPMSGVMLGGTPMVSPRGVVGDHMLDGMSLDMGRQTLIPRLNLEALHMQLGGGLFQPSQFAVPLTPSTVPSAPPSGRVSRLATPSGSVSSAGGRVSGGQAGSASGVSPRGQRVKSTFSARDSSTEDNLPSPTTTSARGKRRRSIYEEDSDLEPEGDEEFVGTYVPTVSSARQKKKRALGTNAVEATSSQ